MASEMKRLKRYYIVSVTVFAVVVTLTILSQTILPGAFFYAAMLTLAGWAGWALWYAKPPKEQKYWAGDPPTHPWADQ